MLLLQSFWNGGSFVEWRLKWCLRKTLRNQRSTRGRASRRNIFPPNFLRFRKKKNFFFRPDNNDVRKSGKRWSTIALRTSLRYLKDAYGGNNNILDIKTKIFKKYARIPGDGSIYKTDEKRKFYLPKKHRNAIPRQKNKLNFAFYLKNR